MPDPHTRPQGETARPAPRGRLGKAILALGALGLVTLVAAYAWFQYAINQPIASAGTLSI